MIVGGGENVPKRAKEKKEREEAGGMGGYLCSFGVVPSFDFADARA